MDACIPEAAELDPLILSLLCTDPVLLSNVLDLSYRVFPCQGTLDRDNSETLTFQNYGLEGRYILAREGKDMRMRVRKSRKGSQMVKQSKSITRCEVLTFGFLNGVNLSR